MRLLRGAFSPAGSYEEAAHEVPLRPCPSWLGYFSFRMWRAGDKPSVPFPPAFSPLVETMEAQVRDQEFNTVFLQRYERGQYVRSHRDPTNNLGYTVIATFGQWEGGVTTVEGADPFRMRPGDLVVLPCTIAGRRGPLHSVSRIEKGIRWTLILNTIR